MSPIVEVTYNPKTKAYYALHSDGELYERKLGDRWRKYPGYGWPNS